MKFLAACWKQVWITLVVALVFAALYTSLGRQLIPLVETLRPDLEQRLSQQLGQPVTIESLNGDWRYLSPILRLEGIAVGPGEQPIRLQRLELELDISASAFYRMPVFKRLELEGLQAHLRLDQQQQLYSGEWALTNPRTGHSAGVTSTSSSKSSAVTQSAADRPLWLRLLELQQRMEITHSLIHLETPSGDIDRLRIDQLLWRHQGNSQSVRGKVGWGREQLAEIAVSAALSGKIWPWSEQHGEVFAYVEPQSWSRWIPDDLPLGLGIEELQAGANLWLTVNAGELEKVYADLALDQLTMTTREAPLELSEGRIRVGGERNGEDWHVRVRPELGEQVPLKDVSVSLISLPERFGWQLGIDRMDFGEVITYLQNHGLMPSPFDRYFANISPQGTANNMRISVLSDQPDVVDVKADLSSVSGRAYRGIPGVEGLDASLHLHPGEGRLEFTDEDVTVDLQGVYDQPWDMDDISGVLSWRIEPEASKIWLSDIKGRWNHLFLRSELSLLIPSRASGKPQHLSLLLGMPDADITDRSRILPDLLDDEVRNWLDSAFLAGELSNGAFMLNGELEADRPDNSLTTQLYLEMNKAELEYLPEWPLIYGVNGRMLLDSPTVEAWVDQGRTLGGEVQQGSGHIRLLPQDNSTAPLLQVTGALTGDSREALRYFHETPLRELVNGAFDQWQAEGPVSAQLDMSLPLAGDDAPAPDVRLAADLDEISLDLKDLDLVVSDISGPLVYDTASGLSSSELIAHTLGGDLYARIESTPVAGRDGSFDTRITARGEAGLTDIKQWMPMFLLDPITGRSRYQAELALDGSSGKLEFRLDSNLEGVAIDYPAPFNKPAEAADQTLALTVSPGRETRISMNFDDRLKGVFALGDNGLDRGQVYLGGNTPFLPSDRGVEVRGEINAPIVAEDWWAIWQRLMPLAEAEAEAANVDSPTDRRVPDAETGSGPSGAVRATATSDNPLRLVELQLADVDAWTLATGPTRLTARQQWGEWNVDIDSRLARGSLTLFSDDRPVDIKLDYLHLPQAEEDTKTRSEGGTPPAGPKQPPSIASILADDALKDMVPADLLPMDLRMDEFMVGGWNFGRWDLSSRPMPDGAALTLNKAEFKGLDITGEGRWLLTEQGQHTWLDMLTVNGRDIGKVQQAFRMEPIIEGQRLKSSASLNWRGSPMAFNTVSLNGLVSVRVENGTWKTEGAGALKAFGALNFNSISRRLQLDFSDLYQSGVAFDTTRAKARIEDGVLTFTEPLVVDGPGAKFLASGMTNLNTEQLDMKLAVTFPVTGSLPLVAVLAGFAAPVAGAIYVTEKLIGDELERFTSASYEVRGTWSKPDMKIREAFDNDVDGKRVRTFKERFLSIFGMEESR